MAIDRELEKLKILAGARGNHVLEAVSDQGETIAAALFADSPVDSREKVLLHVYVQPDYRGLEPEADLLRYAEGYFARQGVTTFRAKCCGNVRKLEDMYGLMLQQGFVPLVVQGRMMGYRLSDWLGSPFGKKMPLMRQYMAQTETIDRWEDPRLQDFLKRENLALPESCYDPRFCRFYTANGKIEAALCAEQTDQSLLYFYGLHFSQSCQKQLALLALLASFVTEAARLMPPDTMVVMQNSISSVCKGVADQFGTPDTDDLVQEYCYHLGSKEYANPETTLWTFRTMAPDEGGDTEDVANGLPLYDGLSDEVRKCLRGRAGMVPETLTLMRKELRRPEESRSWRQELSDWEEQLGKDPLPPEKALHFDAYLHPQEEIVHTEAEPEPEPGPEPEFEPEEDEDEEQERKPAEMLEYIQLPAKTQSVAAILPEFLRERYLQGAVLVLGGRNKEGKLRSFAAFSEQKLPVKTVRLEHIYVDAAQRGQGLGTELLSYARKRLAGAGLRGIAAKQAGSALQVERLHRFLKQAGFRPVTTTGTISVYYLQDLYDTVLMSLIRNQFSKMPRAEEIAERGDFRLRQLMMDSRQNGFVFDRMRFDPGFSRFYVKDGVIRAAICVEQEAENVLIYKGAWYAPGYDTPYVRVALLAGMLEAARRRLREDGVLVMQYDESAQYEYGLELLGRGAEELHMCEYVAAL